MYLSEITLDRIRAHVNARQLTRRGKHKHSEKRTLYPALCGVMICVDLVFSILLFQQKYLYPSGSARAKHVQRVWDASQQCRQNVVCLTIALLATFAIVYTLALLATSISCAGGGWPGALLTSAGSALRTIVLKRWEYSVYFCGHKNIRGSFSHRKGNKIF